MKLKFTKMHGLGNDFMVIDGINQTLPKGTDWVKKLSDRHQGIGFDQCLIVAPTQSSADFFYRIINANGSEVGQCGNGARCLASFIKQQGLSQKARIQVETIETNMQLRLNNDDSVTVTMDEPCFSPSNIPLLCDKPQTHYALNVDGVSYQLHAVNVGNPHGIVIVDELDNSSFETLAPKLSSHALFPKQANISFMQLDSAQGIQLRVFERGAGETLACGSAAAAAAACAMLYHHAKPQLTVEQAGGALQVHWAGPGTSLSLTGPASFVFEGVVVL